MSDNRPPVYWEDDELIIRASAIGGSCLFELVAAGQGYELLPVPPKLQRAFDAGNYWEPIIIKRLEDEYQFIFQSTQGEGNLKLGPLTTMRYHPDGISFIGSEFWLQVGYNKNIRRRKFPTDELPPRKVVVEIKALSDVLWQKFVKGGMETVIDEYPYQLSGMMHDTGLPGLWVGYNKGITEDENGYKAPCKDEGKLYFQLVMEAPVPLSDLIDIATQVRELVTGDDILDTQRACDDYNHWPCRYLYLRPEGGRDMGTSDEDILVIGAEDQDEVDKLFRDYYLFKGQADENKKRADYFKQRILEVAGTHNRITTDKWDVPIVSSSSSKIVWDEMNPEEKELMEKFKRQTPYKYVGKGKRLDE